jgi:hypothetical protein
VRSKDQKCNICEAKIGKTDKSEVHEPTSTVGNYSTSFTAINKTCRQKTGKAIKIHEQCQKAGSD